jgi:DcmR-like sensory protein
MEQSMKLARTTGHFHAVRFYENDESLCRIVAEFLGEGLVDGQPALVVATPEQRSGIMEKLRARHIDIDQIQAAGGLLLLDARDALSSFMVDGLPDAARFSTSMTATINRACRGRTDCNIRVYGQMVDLLWKDGLTVAAIRLEILWNQLAMTRDFSLVCGYAMGNFYKDAQVEDICRYHSHGIASDGVSAPIRVERATTN